MKRTTSRPLARQPRGLPSPAPRSPFQSRLPQPAQRRQLESAALGKRVAAVIALALAAGCVISYFAYRSNAAMTRSLDAAGRTAQTFVLDLTAHDFWDAAKQLSPSAQRMHSPYAIKQEIEVLEARDGTILSSRINTAEPRSVEGLQTYRASYWLSCERGRVPMRLILVRGYRSWSVESYSFG